MSKIPRIIWSFWDTGDPGLVNRCLVSSWEKHKANWEINIVSLTTVSQYLSNEELPSCFHTINSPQKKADAVRMALLAKHGGVWLDMSTLVLRDFEWVQKIADKGANQFIGFQLDGYKTINSYGIENWFFACEPGSYIVSEWRDKFFSVLENTKGDDKTKEFTEHEYYQNVELTPALQSGKNYFTHHICMQWLQQNNNEFKRILDSKQCKIFDAVNDGPFLLFEGTKDETSWDVKKLQLKDSNFIKDIEKENPEKLKFLKFNGNMIKQMKALPKQMDGCPVFKSNSTIEYLMKQNTSGCSPMVIERTFGGDFYPQWYHIASIVLIIVLIIYIIYIKNNKKT